MNIFRVELQYLRALAVIAVVVYHAELTIFSRGYLGVDIFFVLSGYLIAAQIFYSDLTYPSLLKFIRRRLSKLYPMLILTTFTTFIVFSGVFPDRYFNDLVQASVSSLLGLSNFLYAVEAGYFDSFSFPKPLLHTWSLSVELQFYSLVALLFAVSILFKKRLITILFSSFAISLLVVFFYLELIVNSVSALGFLDVDNIIFYTPLVRFSQFMAGVWTYELVTRSNFTVGFKIKLASGLGLLILLNTSSPFHGVDLFGMWVAVFFSVLIIMPAKNEVSHTVEKVLFPLRVLGDASYSIYLVHMPLILLFYFYSFQGVGSKSLMFLLIFSLGFIAYYFYEEPVRKKLNIKGGGLAFFCIITAGVTVVLVLILFKSAPSIKYPEFVVLEEDIEKVRAKMIGSQIVGGKCQFYGESYSTASEFVRNWDCNYLGESFVEISAGNIDAMRFSNVAIGGDSTAADLAMMFRVNGFNVTQMGGAGCSIDPLYMSASCSTLFEFYRKWLAADDEIRYLILRQRRLSENLSENAVERIVKFWSEAGKKLVFAPAPIEYPNMKGIYDRASMLGERVFKDSSVVMPNFDYYKSSIDLLKWMEERGQFMVFDFEYFSCANGKFTGCSPKGENGLLLYKDQVHWSSDGAKARGNEVINKLVEVL